MKTLVLDIENIPPGAWVFGPRTVKYIGPGNIQHPGGILCFAAKWVGSTKTYFHSVHHDGHADMIKEAWHLLDQADAVVTYYGKRHDMPHLNRDFLIDGLGPPSPHKDIDIYYTVRSQFAFEYNSLDYVTKQLGLSGKANSGGLPGILACMQGDEQAWKTMKRYNIRDVMLTEVLYEFVKPWIKGHPNHGAHEGADVCPKCGSEQLERRGFAYTAQGKYQQYHCQSCGSWPRGTKRLEGTRLVEAA